MDMEIEIQSKIDNPLLKRTEVRFMVHHESEKTPKRELVRSELADKLKVKKENVIVSFMESSFGSTDTIGYAKIHKSLKEAASIEKKYILKRNNAVQDTKKAEKKESEEPAEKASEKPQDTEKEASKDEQSSEQVAEKKTNEKIAESSEEKTQEAEKPQEEKADEEKKE